MKILVESLPKFNSDITTEHPRPSDLKSENDKLWTNIIRRNKKLYNKTSSLLYQHLRMKIIKDENQSQSLELTVLHNDFNTRRLGILQYFKNKRKTRIKKLKKDIVIINHSSIKTPSS